MSSPKEYRDKFRKGLKGDFERLDAGMAADVESAVNALHGRAAFHEEKFRRAGNELRNDIKKKTVEQAPPPRALPKATSKIKLDLFSVCALALLAGAAVYAAYAALQHGLFGGSVWQLAGWLLAVAAVVIVAATSQGVHQTEIAHSKYATREDIDRYGIETVPARPDAKIDPSKDQGIYLGTFDDPERKWSTAELRYKGEKHLLCFGPPGSGKSAAIMVPNLRDLPRSMIVTDPKGELAGITEPCRRTLGNTIVLNPFGVLVNKRAHLKSGGWNPLKQLKPKSDDFPTDAMCIADALVENSAGNSGNKFFDDYAKNLVQALVMWEVETKKEAANLRNIRALMNTDATFPAMMFSDNRVVREMGTDVYNRLADKSSHSTSIRDGMQTLNNNLAFLNDARIEADMARGGAIDFAALHRTITTIYLILPPGQLKEQARWLRLFINLALRKMYEAAPSDEAPPTLPPVLIALDEFGNLGRLEEIITALNMARFSRLQLLFFLQNIGQLNAYQDEVDSFFSGAGASTTFKTGGLDIKTAEHLAKAFGNQEMMVASESRQGGSVKPEAIPLIRPEDIARLPPSTTISMIEPCPWPVLANAPLYKHTRFNEGLAPHPYHHG